MSAVGVPDFRFCSEAPSPRPSPIFERSPTADDELIEQQVFLRDVLHGLRIDDRDLLGESVVVQRQPVREERRQASAVQSFDSNSAGSCSVMASFASVSPGRHARLSHSLSSFITSVHRGRGDVIANARRNRERPAAAPERELRVRAIGVTVLFTQVHVGCGLQTYRREWCSSRAQARSQGCCAARRTSPHEAASAESRVDRR